jgi:phage protein D
VAVAENRLDAAVLTINGRPLPAELYSRLLLVRVEESVQLADAFEIRFEDAYFKLFDKAQFTVGDRVEIAMHADGDPVQITAGEVTALSVEQGAAGRHELVLIGFSLAHRLTHVPKRRSFQRMSDADIARRIAAEYSLQPDVEGTSGALDHVLQSNETDFAFLTRRAARIGFDCWVTNETLHFKPKPQGEGQQPPALRWGENLQRFSVRFSAIERCDEVVTRGWDPLGKRSVTGHAREGDTGTDAPAAAELASSARSAFGSVQRYATAFPVADQAEADALAQSLMLRASGDEVYVRGEAQGNPLIGAGSDVRIERVGTRLSGRYRITSVTHIYGSHTPYVTRFVSGGKVSRSLTDLIRSRTAVRSAGGGLSGLVVGQVTNNDDPEKLCRVKVKFPALTEDDESTWARLASPGAGPARGMQWVPEINDEVLVGFELGDTNRPIVLGGLWNRSDTPPESALVNGGEVKGRLLASRKNSRVLLTDAPTTSVEVSLGDAACRLHLEKSSSSLEGEDKLVISASQIEIKATNSVSIEGARITVKASGELAANGQPIRLN